MSREIPEVVRAAAGLAATVLDEARRLPETLPGLPVRVLGVAMQQAMKVQQTYAGLVARGDELLTGLRGDAEPGLATFDDDDEDEGSAPAAGFRDSAFDRVTDDDVAPVLAAAADAGIAVDDAVIDSADAVATAERTIDSVTEEPPSTEEVLEELAIDEAVPEVADTDPLSPEAGTAEAAATEDADALGSALVGSGDTGVSDPSEDGAATVDVLTPDGGIETVEGAVTDEGVAAVEAPQDDTGTDETVAATDGAATDGSTGDDRSNADDGGTAGTRAPAGEPVAGYDTFSVAQLRGRLRGYTLGTVADLLAYEEANQAREPYLRMLRNRLEKLEEQAVESSPLAPRGL